MSPMLPYKLLTEDSNGKTNVWWKPNGNVQGAIPVEVKKLGIHHLLLFVKSGDRCPLGSACSPRESPSVPNSFDRRPRLWNGPGPFPKRACGAA